MSKKIRLNYLKRNHIVSVVLLPLFAVVLIAAGSVYAFTSTLTSNPIPIVTSPPLTDTTPSPLPTSSLPVITGEPKDIGVDYDDQDAADPADPTPAPTAEPIYQKVVINEDVMNILIIGQDLRPNETGRGRSDTMMLLSYNRKEGRASIVSMMRDAWVPIKGHDWNRLNTPFRFGGPGFAINTINDLFNLDIQNYIVVNFDGMSDLVDKIGGVDVKITEVEAAYYNKNYGWNITAGEQHLNGEQALIHARNRKSNGGDFERVRRQQDIIMAVYKKLGAERDPAKLAELAGFVMQNVKTNLSADTLFTLGLEIVQRGNLDIKKGRMPADNTWKYANKDGRSVLAVNLQENAEYLHKLIYDK